jgi:hypothetical protein
MVVYKHNNIYTNTYTYTQIHKYTPYNVYNLQKLIQGDFLQYEVQI